METQSNTTFPTSLVFLGIIAFLVLAMAGEFFYFHQKLEKKTKITQVQQEGRSGRMPPMMMTPSTPPPLSDQQNQQLTLGLSTSIKQKTFNITGGNFYFVPNKITVHVGDQVTFVMTNVGGVHNLVIDELSVHAPIIKTGEAESVTFTASKAGTYVYYCSVTGHKDKGMWGTLLVE